MRETRKRSVAKALTWRAAASMVTLLVTLAFGLEATVAMGITAMDCGAKLAAYYAHERAWAATDLWRRE